MPVLLLQHKTLHVAHQICGIFEFGTLSLPHLHIPSQKTIYPEKKINKTTLIMRMKEKITVQ